MTSSLTGRFWYDRPQDAGVDPDFDDLENLSGLTLAQIRDPIGLEFGVVQDLHAFELDKKRYKIRSQRYDLNRLNLRLRHAHRQNLWRARQRLQRLGQRFDQLADWQLMTRRKPRKAWLPKIGVWMEKRVRQHLDHKSRQLQALSKRLHAFHMSETKNYPKFWFDKNIKCNKCIPYNGHHTYNYWCTGQKDPW